MNNLDNSINKIKTLHEEIIAVKENTQEGQKRLKEIIVELSKSNKELLSLLQKDILAKEKR